MLFIIGWLLLGGYLLNEGNTFWGNVVLLGGLILIILTGISVCSEDAKARANQRHYWAHYYDKDQVAARKRNGQKTPPPRYHDGFDEYM